MDTNHSINYKLLYTLVVTLIMRKLYQLVAWFLEEDGVLYVQKYLSVLCSRKNTSMLVGLEVVDDRIAGFAKGWHLFVGQEVFNDQVSFIVELPPRLHHQSQIIFVSCFISTGFGRSNISNHPQKKKRISTSL